LPATPQSVSESSGSPTNTAVETVEGVVSSRRLGVAVNAESLIDHCIARIGADKYPRSLLVRNCPNRHRRSCDGAAHDLLIIRMASGDVTSSCV